MKRIITAAAIPADDEGVPSPFFVQVGTTGDGRVVLDAEDRAQVPEGAEVVSEGAGRYARAALGTIADRVLKAIWERGTGEDKERRREKVTAANSRNPTVTIIESDIPPHRWLGES